MALIRDSRRIFDWLRTQRKGTIVPYDVVMEVARWKDATLETYLRKNKLAPFLCDQGRRTLRVRLDGHEITEQYFDSVFTQQAGPSD